MANDTEQTADTPGSIGRLLQTGEITQEEAISRLTAVYQRDYGTTTAQALDMAYKTVTDYYNAGPGYVVKGLSPSDASATASALTSQAVSQPSTTPVPPPTEQEAIDPLMFQGVYEQALGIPAVGRSWYDQWKADQFQQNLLAFQLAQQLGAGTDDPSDWRQWLQNRMAAGTPLSQTGLGAMQQQFSALAPTGPRSQREILKGLPSEIGSTGDMQRMLLSAALRRRYSRGAASQMATSAFTGPRLRAFEALPSRQVENAESYLDYLTRRYGL